MDAPFRSRGTQTFTAWLTADAMIAPWVVKGAMGCLELELPRFRAREGLVSSTSVHLTDISPTVTPSSPVTQSRAPCTS